jgi:hypothetical protein
VGDFRNARVSIRDAWRGFHWREYRPFAWMMLVELLFVCLAMNLGKPWGMAGAGPILRLSGERAVHYPASFVFLSSAYARVESFLFAFAGSFLIPLSLVRIMGTLSARPLTGAETVRRARRAYRVTLAGYILNFALLLAWEFLLPVGPHRWFGALLGGFKADLLTWCVGVLVAFAIAVVFLYVPIRAVEENATFRGALWDGIGEGFRSFGPTLVIVLAFAWPALLFLAPVQLAPMLLVARFRPELTAILIAIAAVMNSFVNYFIYSAASRLHGLTRGRES